MQWPQYHVGCFISYLWDLTLGLLFPLAGGAMRRFARARFLMAMFLGPESSHALSGLGSPRQDTGLWLTRCYFGLAQAATGKGGHGHPCKPAHNSVRHSDNQLSEELLRTVVHRVQSVECNLQVTGVLAEVKGTRIVTDRLGTNKPWILHQSLKDIK